MIRVRDTRTGATVETRGVDTVRAVLRTDREHVEDAERCASCGWAVSAALGWGHHPRCKDAAR